MKKRALALCLAVIGTLLCGGCAVTPVDGGADMEWDGAPTAYMALTFDDGPSAYTEELLEGLEERGVCATFFLIGRQIEENIELVQEMAEAGHQIGNHSYDHADLTGMDSAAALADIQQCDALLQTLLGEGIYWVRPPYGVMAAEALCDVKAPLITWSVDTEDWKSRSKDAILDVLYRTACDGCIILLHDRFSCTVSATLEAIDHLRAQGVVFLTVEELFRVKGCTAQNGILYKKVPEA